MNSVEGKGIEMIRTDQCEYVQQLSYELLLKVFLIYGRNSNNVLIDVFI